MSVVDLTGKTFGRLTVINCFGSVNKKLQWYCLCSCGCAVIINSARLNSGHTQSCGCFRVDNLKKIKKTHGESKKTKEYKAWAKIKERCYSVKYINYHNYGGRGITVCDRWRNSYENFLADVGRAPTKDHSIDRMDNDKGYYKENCRWATPQEQSDNRRCSNLIYFKDEHKSLREWCIILNLNYGSIYRKITKGLCFIDAVSLNREMKVVPETTKKKT